MSETLSSSVPHFNSPDTLRQAMSGKASFQPIDLYPRDGSRLQGDIEGRIAELNGLEPGQALSYRSGMAATTGAIDVAMHLSGKNRPNVACAVELYSQTKRYAQNFLSGPRARILNFDSGNTDAIEDALTKHDVDVAVAETVANYQNIPVLDVEHMLEVTRDLGDKAPTWVLDNTAPLSTGKPLADLITEEDRVIVVESGTKSYAFNGPLLGIAYSKNPELLQWLRMYRRTRGDVLGDEAEARVFPRLPETREDFDARNKKLFTCTGELALELFDAAVQSGADNEFVVAHPEIPTHPNARLFKDQYPNGGAPFTYVSATPRSELSQHDMLERLMASSAVHEQALFGQSFGFDQGRIIYDEHLSMVRISGGANIDGKAFGRACAEALFKIS